MIENRDGKRSMTTDSAVVEDPTRSVFLVGTRWFGVLGPCKEIIENLVSEGLNVYIFGQRDSHYHRYFQDNCTLIELRMRRSYFSPGADFLDVMKIRGYMRRVRPCAVHSFNPKPSLIGYAALLGFKKTEFFVGVTGLGNTFIRAPKLERYIVSALRMVCGRARFVFFQNPDDVAMFKEKRIVDDKKVMMFTGPGVDLQVFRPDDRSNSQTAEKKIIRVGCTARLIWQKGIREYLACAGTILADPDWSGKIEFYLYGEVDLEHPDRVAPEFIENAVAKGIVRHISWTDDIASEIRKLDIFVLHSYREGAPRAILEASATSIPTVGSDAIGVRELIVDGVTGFITPLHDVGAMKDRILKLAADPILRRELGAAARARIGEKYSLEKATAAQLAMYETSGVI